MNSIALRRLAVLLVVLISSPAATAMTNEDGQAAPAQEPSQAGSMLSDGMVKSILKRTSHELANSLQMDDAQRDQFTQTLYDRWIPFLHEHRRELAPIVDRFIQAQWDPEMPDADEALAWASKALELHDALVEEVEKSNQEIAKLLRTDQLAQFKDTASTLNAGLSWFKVELRKIESGQLSDTSWAKRRLRHEERRQRHRKVRQEREVEKILTSPKLTALSLDLWDQYVISFVHQFGLDDAQKVSANSILRDVKERADRYAQNHADEITAARKQLQSNHLPNPKQPAERDDDALMPLYDLFAELQSRLDQLPTEAQRGSAAPVAQQQPEINETAP